MERKPVHDENCLGIKLHLRPHKIKMVIRNIQLQGVALVAVRKGTQGPPPTQRPTPNPSLRRGGPPITLPWKRVHPTVCSHNVHSLAGAVPRAGPKTMFDRLFNHPQLGPVFVASST